MQRASSPAEPRCPDHPGGRYDYLLVGGGLQSALVVMAVLSRRPDATIALVEREQSLGGNHLWSFHATDISERARRVIAPLVEASWPGYDVVFPGLRRSFDARYEAITSARLDRVVRARLLGSPGCALLLGQEAREVTERSIALADGRRLEGRLVVDARGPDRLGAVEGAGFQKFVGLEVELARPTSIARPTLMDATGPQDDGFRFFYVLPLASNRLLVEDTCFSDTPGLDRAGMRARVLDYLAARRLAPRAVLREEAGVLPLPWARRCPPAVRGPLVGGYRGGWFHPTTGYSVPAAARLAELIADRGPDEVFGGALDALAREQWSQARFCRLLNLLLFRAYPPGARRHVMERFYRLPEPTIRRFHALALTPWDRLRIVSGKPPRGLSLRRALRAA